jgi:hypothetical protein
MLSSVGITVGYRLDSQDLIPGRGKRFFSSSQHLDWFWGPASPSIQSVTGILSLGIRQLGLEADHFPPSNAEVKNGGAIPPLHHASLWRGA